MPTFHWSEIFLSIEGEARFSGQATLFVRFTGCNFTCRGFNNPDNKDITDDVLGFRPADYTSLAVMPPVMIGCDSIYSWDSRFRHVWEQGTEAELAAAIHAALPDGTWRHPKTGRDVILCLTGGEPTLRAKTLPALLARPELDDVRRLLIETNCSVPLPDVFLDALAAWSSRTDRQVIWSNSPKLSASGEAWADAIRPEVALQQRCISNASQYFKFVCGDVDAHFDEVERAMEVYFAAGIPRDVDVYVMPMACTEEQQQLVAARVAMRCLARGYVYCHRIHSSVFGNTVGT